MFLVSMKNLIQTKDVYYKDTHLLHLTTTKLLGKANPHLFQVTKLM